MNGCEDSCAVRCRCGWKLDVAELTEDGRCPQCGEQMEEPEESLEQELRAQALH